MIADDTPQGIKTTRQEHEFDTLIYATGFDGVTGAYAGRIVNRLRLDGLLSRRVKAGTE